MEYEYIAGLLMQLAANAAGTGRPLVMLVDEFEDALAIYAQYLDYCGYRVVVARNGDEAVTVAHSQRPHLILLDVRMPLISGTQAHASSPRRSRLRRNSHRRADGLCLGWRAGAVASCRFDDVISKPHMPGDLVASVRRLLRQGEASQAEDQPQGETTR